jgi:hypothetical protein
VNRGLLLELLSDLRLPGWQVNWARLDGSAQAYAESQTVLVLMGERNQTLVAQHSLL